MKPVSERRFGVNRREYPGRLFIVEGIDGSGKSTQLTLLAQWLRSEGYPVVFSEWNSSPIVKATTSRGKKRKMLTPLTFSLIHATDFSDRVEREIVPSLKAGAHRARRPLRLHRVRARRACAACDPRWVRSLYRFAAGADAWRSTSACRSRSRCKRILSGPPQAQVVRGRHGPRSCTATRSESYRLFQSPHPRASTSRLVQEFEPLGDGRDAAGRGPAAAAARRDPAAPEAHEAPHGKAVGGRRRRPPRARTV